MSEYHSGHNGPALPGRRSNLRLAFPSQGSRTVDRPQNNDYTTGSYTVQMSSAVRLPRPTTLHLPPLKDQIQSNDRSTPAENSDASTPADTSAGSTPAETSAASTPAETSEVSTAETSEVGSPTGVSEADTPSEASDVSTFADDYEDVTFPETSRSLTERARPSSKSLASKGLLSPSNSCRSNKGNELASQICGSQKEKKKKHLVLNLPPSGSHVHHHSHHHSPNSHHHRHALHHEGVKDRGHRREKISRGIYQNIQASGKLKISPELQVEFTADDLSDLGEIGRGGYGTVNKMVHRKTNVIMAVKRIRSTVDEKEQKQLLMDLDVVMRSNDCHCIVQFYGAIFKEGDCWICMELMDSSLDKFYKFIYDVLEERIPENILGKITVATLSALNYLKEKLKIIHRDVKPSNILLDKRGNIKLCDFGISGQLVDSIAKTRDAGCRPYMAPERIDPARARGYDVRSDVWSLGITLMELATGSFPYPKWNSVFEQLTQVVQGEPPRLSPIENGNTFTEEFVNFVNTCLIKDESSRPKYRQLLEHEFIMRSRADPVDVAKYVCSMLDKMANNGRCMYTYDYYNY